MIDTVRLVLGEYELNEPISFLEEVGARIKIDKYKSYGNKLVGWLDNMRIEIKERRLWIEGSLSKYANGHNVYGMKYEDIKGAIDSLSNRLGVPLYEARVTRIDVAETFEMKEEVPLYLKRLMYLDGFNHISFNPNCVYFLKDSKKKELQLCFYNKTKEIIDEKGRRRNLIIDGQYDFLVKNKLLEAHLLRYELRILNVRKVFRHVIRCYDLFSADFYSDLVELWQDMYEKVGKRFDLKENIEMQNWNGVSDLKRFCLEICTISAYGEIKEMIEDAYRMGKEGKAKKMSLQNKSNMLREMRKAKEVAEKKYAKDSLIEELNKKVDDTCKEQVISLEMSNISLLE